MKSILEELLKQFNKDEQHRLERIVKNEIPLRFITADLSKTRKEVQEYYKKDIFKEKGLYLYGQSGVGKTYSVCALAIYLLINEHVVQLYNLPRLLDMIRMSYQKQTAYNEENETTSHAFVYDMHDIKQLFEVEILIIDDIGKEKVSEWVAEKLYDIINTRYENMKTTIFTSNLSLDELASRSGYESITSRIAEMCNVYKLSSSDKRLNK